MVRDLPAGAALLRAPAFGFEPIGSQDNPRLSARKPFSVTTAVDE